MCCTVFPYLLASHSVAGVPAESLIARCRVKQSTSSFRSSFPPSPPYIGPTFIKNHTKRDIKWKPSLSPPLLPRSPPSFRLLLPPSWWRGHLSIKRGWVKSPAVWPPHRMTHGGTARLSSPPPSPDQVTRLSLRRLPFPTFSCATLKTDHTHNRDETSQMTDQYRSLRRPRHVSEKCSGQALLTQRSWHQSLMGDVPKWVMLLVKHTPLWAETMLFGVLAWPCG